MLDWLVRPAYNRLFRPLLPRKIAVFNGVPVRQPRLLDKTDVRPDYESALVAAINEEIQTGESVVTVGGGWGVCSVYAARCVGDSGSVITFEGGREQVDHVRETLELNLVTDNVDVRHAVVGTGAEVYGDATDAETVTPTELPNCNVLVLDCEGAEMEILDELAIRPRSILVETHPMYDAPAEDVRTLLDELAYDVVSERLEKTRYGELPVLTARRRD